MRIVGWLALLGGVATVTFTACGSDDSSTFDGGDDSGGGGSDSTLPDTSSGDGCTGPFCSFDGSDTGSQQCTNLCLKQVTCPNQDGAKVTTTLSGTVYDPA